MSTVRTFLGILPAVLFLAFGGPAAALQEGPYSMEILVNGSPLVEYAARKTTYIEALERREYAVRLRNRTGERIAVALSVDGLNTIDAKTTSARDASKWIIEPYGTITISGWQTGASTARRFFFTSEQCHDLIPRRPLPPALAGRVSPKSSTPDRNPSAQAPILPPDGITQLGNGG